MLQTISAESNSISEMAGETAEMKWTSVPENNLIGSFALYREKPERLQISAEIAGTITYNKNYTNRLTVVRRKSGNDDIIITATLTKLAISDINTYRILLTTSLKTLISTIILDVKGL